MRQPFIIVVDGPCYSGKTTLVRELGKTLDMPALSIGSLFRLVARHSMPPAGLVKLFEDGEKIGLHGAREGFFDESVHRQAFIANLALLQIGDEAIRQLDDPELRNNRYSGLVTDMLTRQPPLRRIMDDKLPAYAATQPGMIVDGKDATRANFANAQVKLYLFADMKERMRRTGLSHYEIERRDEAEAALPKINMTPHVDAMIVNTSNLSPKQLHDMVLSPIRRALAAYQTLRLT